MSTETGETAVYSVHGELMADEATDALVSFAVDNFVDLVSWRDVRGPMRPRQMANWMPDQTADHCVLFALRDLYTPTQKVVSTPER